MIDMIQEVARSETIKLDTLRCPIRIDGEILKNPKARRVSVKTRDASWRNLRSAAFRINRGAQKSRRINKT